MTTEQKDDPVHMALRETFERIYAQYGVRVNSAETGWVFKQDENYSVTGRGSYTLGTVTVQSTATVPLK